MDEDFGEGSLLHGRAGRPRSQAVNGRASCLAG